MYQFYEYVKFISAALLNVILVICVYFLDKKTRFKNFKRIYKELIIGVFFGCSAIYASLFGVKIWGATMNVRDASPISAGLIFGPIAGIVSGFIGGGFRALTVLWNPDSAFTAVACSLSTFLAGVIAAILRKFMFDDKKPSWVPAIGIAIVLEVFHMLMIFITNMDKSYDAFLFVKQCTLPMIIANSISVGLSLIIIAIISKEKVLRIGRDRGIAQTFQRWLLLCIILAYAVTSIFTYNLQTGIAETQVKANFTATINDVENDVRGKSNAQLLSITNEVKNDYVLNPDISLDLLTQKYQIKEINVVNEKGIIKKSTELDSIDYDMNSKAQSKEFVDALKIEDYFVQEYGPRGKDESEWRKYAALTLEDGWFIQVGYDAEQFHEMLNEFVIDVTKNRHVGTGGFVAVCDNNLNLVIDNDEYNKSPISKIGISPPDEMLNKQTATKLYTDDVVDGINDASEEYTYVFKFIEGYCLIAAMPTEEVTIMRDVSIMLSTFMQVLIFAVLFLLLYFLIKKIIINNLRVINSKLAQISGGNLDVTIDVRANEEFASLSDDINSTVATLKRYIAEAAARIDKELEYAKQIQLSALPTNFPIGEEYNIYAQMIAAKEVGGDFYDFYKLNENTVAFLVADVSGKGIPAAMFMMTAKTIIKDLAESGMDVNDIFTKANQKLCENNESGMFVTAWMGILDIPSGKLKFANAGHNPPLFKRADGSFEYLKTRAGFVLAGMEGIRYRVNEITLNCGDRLFLYTDGVTEATNENNELYGEDRLLSFMNKNLELNQTKLLPKLKKDIDKFVGEAPQFDDITMLMFDYTANKDCKVSKGETYVESKTFPAKTESLTDVLAFIEQILEKYECSMKLQTSICVAIEEVFVNVAHYAYGEKEGDVKFTISFDKQSREITFCMADKGVPFDPLKKPEPDITLSAEEREIGGLGIFITKKTMDSVVYAYENGENILTMIKKI